MGDALLDDELSGDPAVSVVGRADLLLGGTVKLAESHGIASIALENHGAQCVYNAKTLLALRETVWNPRLLIISPALLYY